VASSREVQELRQISSQSEALNRRKPKTENRKPKTENRTLVPGQCSCYGLFVVLTVSGDLMPEEVKEHAEECSCCSPCRCPCHRSPGIFAVLFGLSFLLGAVGVLSAQLVSIAWPSVVILAGASYFFSGYCKCCDQSCGCHEEAEGCGCESKQAKT